MILSCIEVIWCLLNYLCLKKNFTKITVDDQFTFTFFCFSLYFRSMQLSWPTTCTDIDIKNADILRTPSSILSK